MEIIFEMILQLVFELLCCFLDLGFKRKSPIAFIVGAIFWGAIAGGFSLLIYQKSFISEPSIRLVNLFITPLFIGGAMVLIGKVRAKIWPLLDESPLAHFVYAFCFAFSMALVRFLWAK